METAASYRKPQEVHVKATEEGSRPSSPKSPRKHRVLKIAPTSFFSDYGCHVRIYEETRALARMGNNITICTYHTGRNIDNLDIRRALNTPWQNTVQVGSNLHKLYYDVLLSIRAAEVALKTKPSIIHAHLHEGALIGYLISRVLRVPLIFDYQGSLTSEMLDHNFIRRDSLAFRPLRAMEFMINRMADMILTSSYNAAEILTKDFGYPPDKVVTIPDSVDTDFFVPRSEMEDPTVIKALKEELGIPLDRQVVVYLGLLAVYQGTIKLLEAASILARKGLPVHFLIMGYPGEDAYRALAQAMGLSHCTTFTGRIPYHMAPKYLLVGDVAVSPKMSETEGNGKLLNYMAAGLPTVAFDTPVAHEVLGDLGVYAKVGDAQDLAAALESLLSERGTREVLGERLRKRAIEEFSWERAGQRLIEIYEALSR